MVADVEVHGGYQFERCWFAANPEQLPLLSQWLAEHQVEEVVMESTALYWKPVWGALERYWQPICQKREGAGPTSGILHLAQAQSNRGPRGRKKDFRDAERLVKRLVADELKLSFVPDTEQRLWRTLTRRRYQLTRARVQLQNQLEALLEEAHLKLSSLVSDLLGVSARRMLQAIANGETNPEALGGLGDRRLRATPAQLSDALGACTELHPVYRRLIKMMLEELRVMEEHTAELNQELATLLRPHQDAVQRLAEVPGLGVDSAQQILAEVGAKAATFASDQNLCSWVGVCPGDEESAGESSSHRSPQGNRQMRRLLNQAANAAVKTKGSIFEIVYRRMVPRLRHNQTIGAVAHRLCRLIWLILPKGVRYEERGPAVSQRSRQNRTSKMIKELRRLGYRVEFLNAMRRVDFSWTPTMYLNQARANARPASGFVQIPNHLLSDATRSRISLGRGLAFRAVVSMQTPVTTVLAANSPLSSFVISCAKRIDFPRAAKTDERIVSKSPARSSRLYSMCCSTATRPNPSVRIRDGLAPTAAKICQVASSNFPTYHITFMWPMWSQCQG